MIYKIRIFPDGIGLQNLNMLEELNQFKNIREYILLVRSNNITNIRPLIANLVSLK